MNEVVESLDLLHEVQVRLLGLDLRDAPGEVLELPHGVEGLEVLQEALQIVELLPVLLPLLARDQLAPPAGKPRLNLLGGGDDLLRQIVGLGLELDDRLLVCVAVPDEPFGQPEQLEEGDQFGDRNALGLLDVLELEQRIERHLRRLVDIGGVELLPRQAQGDVAVLDQRQQDDQEELWLDLVLALDLHVVLDGDEFLPVDDLTGRLPVELGGDDLGVAGVVGLQLVAVEQFQPVQDGGGELVLDPARQPADHVLGGLLEVADGQLRRERRVVPVAILEAGGEASRAGQFEEIPHRRVPRPVALEPFDHLLGTPWWTTSNEVSMFCRSQATIVLRKPSALSS